MKPSAHELDERARKMLASTALGYVQRWARNPAADPINVGELAEHIHTLLDEMSRLAGLVPEVERLRIDLRLARAALKQSHAPREAT